jgi:sec-independent protein translocase protein TatA
MHAALTSFPVSPLAFLDGIGGMEMLLVFVIGLLLFGGKGMPDMARTLGKAIREFKKATAGVEDQLKRVLEEPPPPRRAPPAVQPRAVEPPTPPTPALEDPAAPPAGPAAIPPASSTPDP